MEMNTQDEEKPATRRQLKEAVQRLEFKFDTKFDALRNDLHELKQIVQDKVVEKLDYLMGKSKDNDRTTVVFDKRLRDDRERLDSHEARINTLETKNKPRGL